MCRSTAFVGEFSFSPNDAMPNFAPRPTTKSQITIFVYPTVQLGKLEVLQLDGNQLSHTVEDTPDTFKGRWRGLQ